MSLKVTQLPLKSCTISLVWNSHLLWLNSGVSQSLCPTPPSLNSAKHIQHNQKEYLEVEVPLLIRQGKQLIEAPGMTGTPTSWQTWKYRVAVCKVCKESRNLNLIKHGAIWLCSVQLQVVCMILFKHKRNRSGVFSKSLLSQKAWIPAYAVTNTFVSKCEAGCWNI